jgi:hypothetical protein
MSGIESGALLPAVKSVDALSPDEALSDDEYDPALDEAVPIAVFVLAEVLSLEEALS